MKLNKKSILALVLSLAMAMSLVPFAAFAEDGENAAPRGDIEITVDEDLTKEKIEELVEEIFEAEAPVNEEPEEEAAEESEETAEAPEEIAEEAAEIIEEPAEEAAEDETAEQLEEAPAEEQPAEEAAEEADEFDVEAAYEYLMTLTEEEEEAYALTLTEEQIEALRAYIIENDVREYKVPETVVFTEAGPFMPAVEVETSAEPAGEAEAEEEPKAALPPKKLMMKALGAKALAAPAPSYVEPTDSDNNGLFLSKTAIDNGNGTYKITLQAYTTGTVTTETSTVPVDIVLVLDQSGSMAYDFNGKSTSTNSQRRQYAMKNAVNNFIDAVNKKYSIDSDHRMAIVTFASSADTLQGWTYVNEAGAATLRTKMNRLTDSPTGGTQVQKGLDVAGTLMGSGYNYNGSNTTRQKVVIVFTDGVPGNSGFDTSVANSAIASAKKLKDAGVTVYSVGIFKGANPGQLYGDKPFFESLGLKVGNNRNDNDVYDYSDGSVGSYWQVRNGIFANEYDVSPAEVPCGNRFLNFLSSNFHDANVIGLSHDDWKMHGLYRFEEYKITRNFNQVSNKYYLTASSTTDLNTIFQTISNNIQTASIDLSSSTVIKDIISPYFTMPANTREVTVKTVDCRGYNNGTPIWSDSSTTLTDGVSFAGGNTVNVSGFDFNANFVSANDKGNDDYGKKLIIEFTVTPKDTFWGGNSVPTNGEASGVYTGSGVCVEKFVQPTVDVPIKEPTISAVDRTRTIYYGQDVPDVEDLFKINEGRNDWDASYVDITTSFSPDAVSDTANGTYTGTVTVTPKNNGTAAAQTKSADADVTVKYCSLTINKSFASGTDTSNDENQSFIFHVKNDSTKHPVEMDVFVTGSDSVTIGKLPIGSYTVTENGGWSWRYTTSNNGTIELQPNEQHYKETFRVENTRSNIYWLNGCSYAINSWTADGVERKKIQKGKEQ